MMRNNFLKNESGETNIVSLIILLAVIIVAYLIFKPWISQLLDWIRGWFS